MTNDTLSAKRTFISQWVQGFINQRSRLFIAGASKLPWQRCCGERRRAVYALFETIGRRGHASYLAERQGTLCLKCRRDWMGFIPWPISKREIKRITGLHHD